MADVDTPVAVYETLADEMGRVLIGNEDIVEGLTIALLTRGHVLLEGLPGVGKTTIADLLATVTGLSYSRIQMTPDVLPADITGTHVYRETTGEFELQKGPVFANVVVADEINRATPKTQSALLEAMQEGQVTIEGTRLELPDPFMVVATQNPIEMEGTFALPEAQRDRFQFKLHVETPTEDEELALLDRFDDRPELGPDDVDQKLTVDEIQTARSVVDGVHVDSSVKRYIRDIVRTTREMETIDYGGSPRAAIMFLRSAKSRAAIRGRDYVTPDDVKSLSYSILNHRIIRSTDAEISDISISKIIQNVLDNVTTPSATGINPKQ